MILLIILQSLMMTVFAEHFGQDFLYHIPIRFNDSSETLKLLLDVNGMQTWIFAERINRLLTFKDLLQAPTFNATYFVGRDGFEATFDGHTFNEEFTIGDKHVNSTQFNQIKTRQIGFAFRSTIENTTRFVDGIFGLGSLIDEFNNTSSQQLTIITNESETKHQLVFNTSSLKQHCEEPFLYESIVNPQTLEWKFRLRNVTLGNNLLSTHHNLRQKRHTNHSCSNQESFALLSTLNSMIVGPSVSIHSLYRQLNVQYEDRTKMPIVDCASIVNASDLVFSTDNLRLSVSPGAYVRRKGTTCYLRILPSIQHTHDWTLGQPFFVGRCLTFDYREKKIGFADNF